jgi:hypothetical protein
VYQSVIPESNHSSPQCTVCCALKYHNSSKTFNGLETKETFVLYVILNVQVCSTVEV